MASISYCSKPPLTRLTANPSIEGKSNSRFAVCRPPLMPKLTAAHALTLSGDVMDLFSRRILDWTLARNRTVEITLRALKRAIALRDPELGLMFHSDRGIEYSAYRYQEFLHSHGISSSINRPRNCQDNAHMEICFHSLKAELTHKRSFTTEAEPTASVGAYINRFDKMKRIHSSLGYHSPVEFRTLRMCPVKCPPNRMRITVRQRRFACCCPAAQHNR